MGRPKQFLKIAGRPMLEWTVSAFQKAKVIDGIVLVVAKEQMARARALRFSKLMAVVEGGKERQDSVKNGLKSISESAKIVVIHDGARPAVTPEIIEKSVREAKKFGAAVVGVPVKDTIKQVSSKHYAVRTLNREELWQAQTPQAFKASIIRKAYAKVKDKVTDDAMLIEKLKIPVKMVMGSYQNIKVTTPEDLRIMESILKNRRE